MSPERMLDELTRAASEIGVEVRCSALRGTHPGHGGLCRIGGRSVVLLNSRATALERGSVLARALSELGFDRLDSLAEETRSLVRSGGKVVPAQPSRGLSGPGLAGLGAHGRRRG